jgi:hypothetical protein
MRRYLGFGHRAMDLEFEITSTLLRASESGLADLSSSKSEISQRPDDRTRPWLRSNQIDSNHSRQQSTLASRSATD